MAECRSPIMVMDSAPGQTVSHSGPGIPPESPCRMFEKLCLVAARHEGKRCSTGLGLTFCKLAVEAQDGQIGVDSDLGKGSAF